MRQTRRLRIHAPHERVWQLLDDDRRIAEWMPHVAAMRWPNGKPEGDRVGARFIQELREGDRISAYEGEVTEYMPGRLIGTLLRPQALAIHTVYHVTGDEDWTLLEYGCDVRPVSWRGWLMLALEKKLFIRIIDQQLARLKLVAEGGDVTPDPMDE